MSSGLQQRLPSQKVRKWIIHEFVVHRRKSPFAKRSTLMELKPLGNTNVMVPEIGLGVWRYSGGVEPLRHGVELGAFLIDTAEIYGTEDVVGQAVKGLRDRVFLATKVSPDHLRYDEMRRAAEASLHRL